MPARRVLALFPVHKCESEHHGGGCLWGVPVGGELRVAVCPGNMCAWGTWVTAVGAARPPEAALAQGCGALGHALWSPAQVLVKV